MGITGNTAAYQMNLYNYFGVGTSFVLTNTSGTYSPTNGVNIASGDPIQVQLVYNPLQKVLVETLTDKNTNVVYTATHAGIDLAATLGATECYVGFTGGSGGDTAIQTISDLVQKTEAEMLRTKNFGRKSLNEIKEILGGLGLGFGMKFDSQGRLVSPAGTPATLEPMDGDDDIDDEDDEEGDSAAE